MLGNLYLVLVLRRPFWGSRPFGRVTFGSLTPKIFTSWCLEMNSGKNFISVPFKKIPHKPLKIRWKVNVYYEFLDFVDSSGNFFDFIVSSFILTVFLLFMFSKDVSSNPFSLGTYWACLELSSQTFLLSGMVCYKMLLFEIISFERVN